MKRIYARGFFLWFVSPSVQSVAQCSCGDGSSRDSLVYNQHYDSIIFTNTATVFPQFNATVRFLSCLRLSGTVTTVVNYNLENGLYTTVDYTASAFSVEPVDSYGQLLFDKNYMLAKGGAVNIQWSNKPASGIYFPEVTDRNHHHIQVEILKIL